MSWDAVEEATKTAKGIAWDGCHKIYVLMDDEQVALMDDYGYGDDESNLIPAASATPEQMLYHLKRWYEVSCGLKFISAVVTNEENPNKGFTDLIPQGWESEDWIDITEEN